MSEDLLNLSNRQKVVLAAALGAGVLVGAGGLIVYQGLNQVSSSFLEGSAADPWQFGVDPDPRIHAFD